MMNYKGFFGPVDYDDNSKVFREEILGLKKPIIFQGKTIEELDQSFQSSIDLYLALCKQKGEKSEKIFSGIFNLRIDPDFHVSKLN